tara:strand:+ start:4656 stop:4838 length:183 start_codon:yes stop_codon:yes gene_type:complete
MIALIIYCLFSYSFVGVFMYHYQYKGKEESKIAAFIISPIVLPFLVAAILADITNDSLPK